MSTIKNNNRVRKGLFYTLYSILGLIVLFVILLAAAPGFMLNTFGFRTYVSHYDQMEPTIKQNALIFVNKINVDELSPDDLVTFQSNSDLNDNGKHDMITGYFNRTVGTGDSTYYYFRSEGSAGDWAVLQEDSLIGGYAFSIPAVGLLIDFFASPFGIAVVTVNACIIVGIVYVVKHGNKEERDTKIENKE